MFELRDYQIRAVNDVRNEIIKGKKKIIMVMPTGAGKSATFSEIIRLALGKGKKALFLVHRRNLVTQMRDTLRFHGVENVGVIMAGHESDLCADVQVGCINTFSRRINLVDHNGVNRFLVDANLVLIDECHRSLSPTYKKVIDHYCVDGKALLIGCTATPARADGRGMGTIYDSLVDVVSVRELIDNGHLSKVRYFAPSLPALDGIKIKRGDYDEEGLDKAMNQPKIIGDVVENWFRIAGGRQTIVFAVSVKHSIALCDAFKRQGVEAYHLDAKSPDDERDRVFEAMQKKTIQVLCNVALYQEGLDCPNIDCVVMARPTKSLGLYRQCGGRGLRPSEGKENLIFIDHGGVLAEHGLLDWEIEWQLSDKEKAWKEKEKKEKVPSKTVTCISCKLVFESAKVCPDCKTPILSFGKNVEVLECDLEELNTKKQKMSMAEKRIWFGMLESYRREKGYKQGWAAWKYREKTGVWPKGMNDVVPITPDEKFYNWMKHLAIKASKSKVRQWQK